MNAMTGKVAARKLATVQYTVTDYTHPTSGTPGAPIMVVCDPQTVAAQRTGAPMDMDHLRLLAKCAREAGLRRDDFIFVGLCPPIPPDAIHSASRKWAHVQPYVEGIYNLIEANNPSCIVSLGEMASRVVLGRAVAITKARGSAVTHNGRMVLPFLSPAFVAKVPDHMPTFESDMVTLARLKEAGFSLADDATTEVHYEWREDISDIIAMRPEIIAVDTETTGLTWHDPAVQVLTVQISWAPGKAVACPVDAAYWPAWQGRGRARAALIGQLKTLLEDPAVRKVGHNLKFDLHMLRKLGIEMDGWSDDTQLLAFAADENMMEKSLDECVRRWVPAMAGYADAFNQTVDKSDMRSVSHDKLLPYAAGDVDATIRLFRHLDAMLKRDRRQYNCYVRILMPSIKVFANIVERHGMLIDRARLETFEAEVAAWLDEEYKSLIRMVPRKVRLQHLEAKQELSFSRTAFVRDILFGPDGFKLKPLVFTKTTANLPPEQREPSTSAKDHLPWFINEPGEAGEFVTRLIEYQKSQKMLSTYIRGFYRYIAPNSRIYPSYKLHATVTGRTASDNPNGQNFPKRGQWAKPYLRIFQATPGYRLVNCDLSQIELRLAAWMANEPTMMRIYREGGDIHTATAQAVSGVGGNAWASLPHKERKKLRTNAKAVNFGFLYGMGPNKFREFAKTSYGVTYSQSEAEEARRRFFQTYGALPRWHDRMREFAGEHGMVRALHGAVRHLPSIFSTDEITRGGAQRQAINSPVQRFGSDLGLIAMIRFSQQADPGIMRLIGFVHDALVMEVKEGHEWDGISSLLWVMSNPPLQEWFGITPPLPITAEADIGMNGGDMIELAEVPDEVPEWFANLGWERSASGAVIIPAERPLWWRDDVDADFERSIRARLGTAGD
jgi:uracil-DNA glycosylase family 4